MEINRIYCADNVDFMKENIPSNGYSNVPIYQTFNVMCNVLTLFFPRLI